MRDRIILHVTNMINSDPQLTVVGTAFDGLDALKKIPQLHPDVITLDVNMPRMDGLTTLKIMKQHPIPVIMLSATTQEGDIICGISQVMEDWCPCWNPSSAPLTSNSNLMDHEKMVFTGYWRLVY